MIPSRPQTPPAGDRPRSERGQTETISVVLLLGLVVAGTTIVIAFGGAAISSTQDRSDVERVANAMTLFDSHSATVALGDSTVRSVDFGQSGGSFRVDDTAGEIRIVHRNYDGGNNNYTVYQATLGSVIYETDDGETVAYQGGGVWQTDANGNSVMVSPPEFHFRDATLTLPIIQVSGSGGVSGNARATVTESIRANPVYPARTSTNPNAPYPNGEPFANPVEKGHIAVQIESEYAEGWAKYFETRTDGTVTLTGDTAEVVLESVGAVGAFDMPAEGNGVDVRALKNDDHPNVDFTVTLANDGHFNNMHWSLYADEGTEKFEIHIYSDEKCMGGSYGGTVDISLFYSNESGTYEGWQKTFDPNATSAIDVDCSAGDMTVDLASSSESLEYGSIDMTGSDNKWQFGNEIKSWTVRDPTKTFTHDSDTDGQYTTLSSKSLDFLTNHYLTQLGPEFDLKVSDGPGGSSRVDEDASYGSLMYDTGGSQYIAFLHITENGIEVTLE